MLSRAESPFNLRARRLGAGIEGEEVAGVLRRVARELRPVAVRLEAGRGHRPRGERAALALVQALRRVRAEARAHRAAVDEQPLRVVSLGLPPQQSYDCVHVVDVAQVEARR